MMEVDGTLFVIPWSSIKYMQVDPIGAGDSLPSPILKGLRMAD